MRQSDVLPEFPRPQLVRDLGWQNLNGFWEFQPGYPDEPAPVGQALNGTILVPFPVESCLSGIGLNYQVVPRPLSGGLTRHSTCGTARCLRSTGSALVARCCTLAPSTGWCAAGLE